MPKQAKASSAELAAEPAEQPPADVAAALGVLGAQIDRWQRLMLYCAALQGLCARPAQRVGGHTPAALAADALQIAAVAAALFELAERPPAADDSGEFPIAEPPEPATIP